MPIVIETIEHLRTLFEEGDFISNERILLDKEVFEQAIKDQTLNITLDTITEQEHEELKAGLISAISIPATR